MGGDGALAPVPADYSVEFADYDWTVADRTAP